MVFVYPVKFIERQTGEPLIVQFDAPVPTPSKNTSSAAVGTAALSWVFEAVPQLVFPVASQFADEPPATQ